ncbi:MAG: TetR/AcrR family transcriptional regulator [Myxococcaceae bacterium]|jgi:AcrR family transcriptional regulator|nr:TetR/AcrR family transcriptional regulator [Myxococcaceae bacterium]
MPRRRAPKTAPRREARQARSRATVEYLLAATAKVLVREGYDRASTNRIAEVAGVNIASLYQYFPSKEALVARVFERYLARLDDALTTCLARIAEAPLWPGLEALLRTFFSLHDDDPALHRALLVHVPQIDRVNPMLALRERMTGALTAYFVQRRGSLRSTDPALAAHLVVTCAEAIKQRAVLEDARLLHQERFVSEVLELVRRYVVARPVSAARARGRPATSGGSRASRRR